MAHTDERRLGRKQIAESTLESIEEGSYELNGITHDLTPSVARSKKNTRFYAEESLLSRWATWKPSSTKALHPTRVSLMEATTLEGARVLPALCPARPPGSPSIPAPKIAILNFASATKPGGGFLSGAQAQEESIARSSTLYPSLMTDVAQQFYKGHTRGQKNGFYSHAMVYSPAVVVFRDDAGAWAEPLELGVLTSAAVNAGVVRGRADADGVERKIEDAMRERMGRILFLFENQRATSLVLGSFGTGVFKNDVGTVANLWADLLLVDGARFKASFEHVVFAIVGRGTFVEFRRVFEERNRSEPGFTPVRASL